jgi:signal peptidase I
VRALKPLLVFALWVGGFVLAVGALLEVFFVDVIIVGHDGMAPTMLAGEQVLLWRDAAPGFGDVTVCQHPRRPNELVFGRVVGRAGQKLGAFRGTLQINGESPDADMLGTVRYVVSNTGRREDVHLVEESLAGASHLSLWRSDMAIEIPETTVESGRLYLLGDNRAYRGFDSRSFGTVLEDTCRGVVFMRWRPADDGGAGFEHRPLQILD